MSTAKIDKIIITNFSALTSKYGPQGVQKIKDAITLLIAADKNRGLVTELIALDDKDKMVQLSGSPVTNPTDPKENKDGVDAIYKALAPDYLLLLGSIDIIPHQDLKNLVHYVDLRENDEQPDPDLFAYGDLPYACEAGYSREIRHFLGPTRVVSRLPDITNLNDPQYLVNLLKCAASYNALDATSYLHYFAISAETFKYATAFSLSQTFGNSTDLKTIPPDGENWSPQLLQRLSHFINCHGGNNKSRFYGQSLCDHNDKPPALDAAYLNQKISKGTVVAAESCYGGQLFDPAQNQGQMGIANSYLANQAYGFFGSTTMTWGAFDPVQELPQADLICQYFFKSLLNGASLGRAGLEARQKFIHASKMEIGHNLKILAQFNLYGDPSITPVKPLEALEKGPFDISSLVLRLERVERRRNLFSRGIELAKSQPFISEVLTPLEDATSAALRQVAADHHISVEKIKTFKVEPPSVFDSMPQNLAKEGFPSRVHLIFGKPQDLKNFVCLVAQEVDGTIVSVKKIVNR